MARPFVCARPFLLALAFALGPTAAAEVNLVLGAGLRDWEPNDAAVNCGGGVGALYQADFGPSQWDWRPEVSVATAFEFFDDCGQLEVAAGIARRWRWERVELRVSGGVTSMETRDGVREAQVSGFYLQPSVHLRLGERFTLGLAVRAVEVEDAAVGGTALPNDARQAALVFGWRFGD